MNLGDAYSEFLKTELGKDLLSRLDRLYTEQLDKATKADKETAWGLLSTAAGVELVRSELKRVKTIGQKGGGRK